MTRGVRLFLILLWVALPPLVLLGILEVFAEGLVTQLGQGTALLVVGIAAALWAGVIALFASRSFGDEVRALIDVAERGASPDQNQRIDTSDAAYHRLAAALDERNRQLGELVGHLRAAPITEDITVVAGSIVTAARSVTGNPTWALVVLGSEDAALAPAVYAGPDDPIAPVTEMHRWAAVAGKDISRPRHVEGPWGGFIAVPIGVGPGTGLRALLLAPWEGRAAPSSAEMNLLQLLGQHAGAAIEHALLYAELRVRTQQVKRMATIQADFLRGVTHDLQTPLTSIRALAAELEAGPHIDPAGRADLQTIAYQADRLRRMVSQLLVVSRLEAGALTPRQEVFRLDAVVKRTWDALRADRPFALVSDGSDYLAVGDPDRVEQVLWALMDNAVKYSPEATPIAVEIARVGAAATSDGRIRAEVAVIDCGPGMEPDTMDRAFDQFYRAPSARRDAPDGSGVGLYAARGLVRAMGGDIRIERSGDQTRVIFSLAAELIDELTEATSTTDSWSRER